MLDSLCNRIEFALSINVHEDVEVIAEHCEGDKSVKSVIRNNSKRLFRRLMKRGLRVNRSFKVSTFTKSGLNISGCSEGMTSSPAYLHLYL